jgi:hypothetical protein
LGWLPFCVDLTIGQCVHLEFLFRSKVARGFLVKHTKTGNVQNVHNTFLPNDHENKYLYCRGLQDKPNWHKITMTSLKSKTQAGFEPRSSVLRCPLRHTADRIEKIPSLFDGGVFRLRPRVARFYLTQYTKTVKIIYHIITALPIDHKNTTWP